MKILLHAPYNFQSLGGAESWSLNFFKACTLLSHQVFCTSPNNPYIPFARTDIEYDLCLSQAIFPSPMNFMAKKRVHVFHGTIIGNLKVRPWLWLHPRFLRWLYLEALALKNVEKVVAVSDWACQEIRKMGFCKDMIIIPSGGGLEESKRRNPNTCEMAKKNCIDLVFCGRTRDKVKRFHWLFEAMEQCKKHDIPAILHVAGDIHKKYQSPRIHYHGKLDEKKLEVLLNSCDIQINASWYEGSSLAISEGIFKAGLISLLTPVGGNIPMIHDQKTGFFISDSQSLFEKIADLSRHREKLVSMKNLVHEYDLIPSWEMVAKKILEFATN